MSACRKPLILLVFLGVANATAQAADRPTETAAETRSRSVTPIVDVSLTANGGLTGRYLDAEGRGIADARVALAQGQHILAQTTTDRSGAYQFTDVRSGLYQIAIGSQRETVRVWDSSIAPPAARRLHTMVKQETVVRGQIDDSLVAQVGLAVGIGGSIAAAIALVESQNAQDEAAELRRFFKTAGPASP